MELRHLTAFIALSEELHFGRAAARLHLTQPSLSAQLQKLEKSLGVTLVARTSHEVTLTRAGREFESQARLIVRQMDTAARVTRAVATGRERSIDIGYNLPASRHVLPDALARMNRDHSDVVVSLWEKRTGPQLSALKEGTLDVALVYGRPGSAEFRHRRVLQGIPLVAVVGRTHSWAGRSRVPFADLAGQSCILFDREQCPAMYDSIFAAAADNRIGLHVAQTADDPGATAHVVSVKPLVGFASWSRATSAGMGAVGASTVAVKLFDPVPTIDLYLVWRGNESNPAVDAFVRCVEPA
ncbi:LysR substrate-binding domain-containing protein [Rhodococcus sp. IEGM 1381]|uniref:LysR substrate-binding domain-containing protein n=1 Tax=Rhodococcus sp. IEGM 1381 TaxID=3047085 RepID=UPI0024B64743|nr:LysR substrate-binding domain-containing protein [Rhodococcus sp. IEGM 1381]MDI9896308.1 LysR substrate-binding domain-containing protein [Rhodococcus sp. IEGM 1381]